MITVDVKKTGRAAQARGECVAQFPLSAEPNVFDATASEDGRMVVGYLLVAILAGLVSSAIALLLGTSLLFAFGLYALVGTVTVILAALIGFLANKLLDQSTAKTGKTRSNKLSYGPIREQLAGQLTRTREDLMRVLAVDDDPFILNLIRRISAEENFAEITSAASSAEALELLEYGETSFDCFLLDVSMPGIDGLELCRRIRAIPQYHQTPVIMLTGRRDFQNMGDAYRAGATDYATKPFDIKDLGKRLELAREMAQTPCQTVHTDQEYPVSRRRDQNLKGSLDLTDALSPLGQKGLISDAALSSFLTQLPRKDIDKVRMFAVKIDRRDAFQTRSSLEPVSLLMRRLATETVNCFGEDQTVMAYTPDGTLLVATHSVSPPPAIVIVDNIEKTLHWNHIEGAADEGSRLTVSVVGPVPPQGEKVERARMTRELVMALLEDRVLEKRDRQFAGLRTR